MMVLESKSLDLDFEKSIYIYIFEARHRDVEIMAMLVLGMMMMIAPEAFADLNGQYCIIMEDRAPQQEGDQKAGGAVGANVNEAKNFMRSLTPEQMEQYKNIKGPGSRQRKLEFRKSLSELKLKDKDLDQKVTVGILPNLDPTYTVSKSKLEAVEMLDTVSCFKEQLTIKEKDYLVKCTVEANGKAILRVQDKTKKSMGQCSTRSIGLAKAWEIVMKIMHTFTQADEVPSKDRFYEMRDAELALIPDPSL